jgi:nucleoside triphosphate diphosphatase
MKSHFDEFYELLKTDRKRSAVAKEFTLKMRSDELAKEVEEVKQALEKNDLENLKEELGDALWDLFAVMVIAEEKYGFETNHIVKDAINKLHRRKPWMFKNEDVTKEDEIRIWNEVKQQEKADKSERADKQNEKDRKHN